MFGCSIRKVNNAHLLVELGLPLYYGAKVSYGVARRETRKRTLRKSIIVVKNFLFLDWEPVFQKQPFSLVTEKWSDGADSVYFVQGVQRFTLTNL